MVLLRSAVEPKATEPLGQAIVVRHHQTAVAIAAQVLLGKKEKVPHQPSSPASRQSAPIFRRRRSLGAVFDDREIPPSRHLEQPLHRGHLPKSGPPRSRASAE